MGESEGKKIKKTSSTSTKKVTKKKTNESKQSSAKTKEIKEKKSVSTKTVQPKTVFVAAKKDHKFVIMDTAPELEVHEIEENEREEGNEKKKNKKIPIAIWAFFGISLILFCTAFYSAILLPKIKGEQEHPSNPVTVDLATKGNTPQNQESTGNQENISTVTPPVNDENNETPVESKNFDENQTSFLFQFYQLMSEKKSDELLTMLHPSLRNGLKANWNVTRLTKLMAHVIGGQIKPVVMNVEVQNGTTNYKYELHYSLDINSEKMFDEEREMTVQGEGDDAKITNIHCSTHKCSQHPIFWPENFIK